MGFWDDDEVRAAASGGDYVKMLVPGDGHSGRLTAIKKRKFNENTTDERTTFELTFDDGKTLTAGQTLLKLALFDLKVENGDHLDIKLVEIEKRGAKTLKRFRVVQRKKSGEEKVIDQGSPDSVA